MSVTSTNGSILGASTIAAPVLASTGAPIELSIALGVLILSVIATFYILSKFRNKEITK